MENKNDVELVRETIIEFCNEFIDEPYLCYTEHGLHALFYTRLLEKLKGQDLHFLTWKGKKVYTIQKEYRTATELGKTKRQNWDISVIKKPPTSNIKETSYDYLELSVAIEFGLNEDIQHFKEDIRRLGHGDANIIDTAFVVHLIRLFEPKNRISNRDITKTNKNYQEFTNIIQNYKKEFDKDTFDIQNRDINIEIYYAIAGKHEDKKIGGWCIKDLNIEKIN